MPIAKLFLGFLLRFIFIYGLFTVLWFNWGDIYADLFRAGGNITFSSFGRERAVRFLPYHPINKGNISDTRVIISHRQKLNKGIRILSSDAPSIKISSQLAGYTLTVLVITLILATPIISWKRKGWALLWGIILVHFFIIFRMTIGLLFFFSLHQELGIVMFSPFWQDVLNRIYEVLIPNFGIIYTVPIFIWILVTFRRSDWHQLKNQQA